MHSLSKLSETCKKCSHVDNCDKKRMVACALKELQRPALAPVIQPLTAPMMQPILRDTSIQTQIAEQIKKDFYKEYNFLNCSFMKSSR